jgi:hypothetical protein
LNEGIETWVRDQALGTWKRPGALKNSDLMLGRGERLGLLNLAGLLAASLLIVLKDERHLVAFVERIDAGLPERVGVNENVPRPIVRGDKAKAFDGVEKLEST